MMIRVCAILLAAALCTVDGARPRADDAFQKVDCADVPISFSGTGYEVSCKVKAVTASNTVGRKLQQLLVLDADHSGILVIEDVRYLGGYVPRTALIDLFKGFYKQTLDDWQDDGEREGFHAADYTGRDDGGNKAECIAFERDVLMTAPGLVRFLIGFGCSANGRQHVWDTLKLITAAGG